METNLLLKLKSISISLYMVMPELVLAAGILLVVFIGFFTKEKRTNVHGLLALGFVTGSLLLTIFSWDHYTTPITLFIGFIRCDLYSSYFKILIDVGSLLTLLMSLRNTEVISNRFNSEFYVLLLAAVLGAHLLVMSVNFMMVFLSLELLSISSYIIAGYSFTKRGAEGSLKYFLFGSAASAIMLYGFSILFGITGTLNFTAIEFTTRLIENQSALVVIAGILALAGFLYKMAAVPMHIWSPDVYEAAPIPVVAFLSVIPKLAGLVVLSKFATALVSFAQPLFDWQLILGIIAMITIAVGNLSALWQTNAKRLIAYSSIAQSGFLLIAVVCFSDQGMHALLFYSALYVLANFSILFLLQGFEKNGIQSIPDFTGMGKSFLFASVIILVGLISLSGIPPTGGFTSKLFVFASLWSSYEQTGKEILLWLLIFGLLNTVISLFYYLKIPYYSFLKTQTAVIQPKNTTFENFLAAVLVVWVLFLFIRPDILMGWLNTINFVL